MFVESVSKLILNFLATLLFWFHLLSQVISFLNESLFYVLAYYK
jgi:hypothetical protein